MDVKVLGQVTWPGLLLLAHVGDKRPDRRDDAWKAIRSFGSTFGCDICRRFFALAIGLWEASNMCGGLRDFVFDTHAMVDAKVATQYRMGLTSDVPVSRLQMARRLTVAGHSVTPWNIVLMYVMSDVRAGVVKEDAACILHRRRMTLSGLLAAIRVLKDVDPRWHVLEKVDAHLHDWWSTTPKAERIRILSSSSLSISTSSPILEAASIIQYGTPDRAADIRARVEIACGPITRWLGAYGEGHTHTEDDDWWDAWSVLEQSAV
jgi:hypothetical protein